MRAPSLIWSNSLIAMAAASASLHASSTGSYTGIYNEFSLSQFQLSTAIAIGIGAWTWIAYGLHRWVKFKRPGRMHATERGWLLRNKNAFLVGGGFALALSVLPVAVAVTTGRWSGLLWGALAAGITLLYSGFPKPSQSLAKPRNFSFALREFPGAKLWAISAAWALSTAALPMAYAGFSVYDPALWAATGARFLVICALTIPFDIRDLELDNPAMRTLPQSIGPRAAQRWALVMLGVAGLLHSFLGALSDGGIAATWAVYAVMAAVILWAPSEHPHRRYGLLDATLLLLGPAAWIFC